VINEPVDVMAWPHSEVNQYKLVEAARWKFSALNEENYL
jgi:hypothetical protein